MSKEHEREFPVIENTSSLKRYLVQEYSNEIAVFPSGKYLLVHPIDINSCTYCSNTSWLWFTIYWPYKIIWENVPGVNYRKDKNVILLGYWLQKNFFQEKIILDLYQRYKMQLIFPFTNLHLLNSTDTTDT